MKIYIMTNEVVYEVELNEKEVESGEFFNLITKLKNIFDPVVTDEEEDEEPEEETQEETEEGLIEFKVVKTNYGRETYTLTTAWLKDHEIDYKVDHNMFGDERATAKINVIDFCILQKYLKSHGVDATALI